MCRAIENYEQFQKERDRLQIRGFYLRLSISNDEHLVPETLTLLYLPRTRGTFLEINGAKIRPNSGAFISLHRTKSPENEAAFTSIDTVRATDGTCFEIYVRDQKLVRGSFRREGKSWEMEIRCVLEEPTGFSVSSAEICVAGNGCLMMKDKVEICVRRKRVERTALLGLDDIPEEIETESCDCGENWMDEREAMAEKEGLKWVDLGIFVGAAMCLAVGFLVSATASSSRLRRAI